MNQSRTMVPRRATRWALPVVQHTRSVVLGATAGLSSSAESTVGQANRGTAYPGRVGLLAAALAAALLGAGSRLPAAETVPHPSVEQIQEGLEDWSRRWPDQIKVEVVGRTVENRPILLAIVTDRSVPDVDKQVVLLSATHAGDELTSCTGLLHTTRWLLGDDPKAAAVRKGVVTLVMPCLNPDGYYRAGQGQIGPTKSTTTGCNVYGSWAWDGPQNPEKNPEGVALFKVAEKYQPDASFDVHGVWYREMSMWESTAFSWFDFRGQSYCPLLAEQMNQAAEEAGFLIVRPGEDSGRIPVSAPVEGLGHHFYYLGNGRSVTSFLFNRYHTLALNCEAGYDGSVLARTRRLLELGEGTWRNEFFSGYPVNQLGGWGSMTVSAWGPTAQARRQSRLELWRNMDRVYYSLALDQPTNEKLMAVCATNVPAAMRFVGDGQMKTLLAKLADHPTIDVEPIAQFVEGTTMTYFDSPANRNSTQGYNTKNPSTDPIRHGLALRLYIPYRDAKIVDARIDGHPVGPSPADGYLVRHDPGTVVQLNIPPGKVGDLHVVTCQYTSPTKHPQGFRPEDWR